MSRRITTQSQIKDREFAIKTLKSLSANYQDAGNDTFRITSGSLRNATLDLKTGNIFGDSDNHSRSAIEEIRRKYTELKYRDTIFKQGATVESRTVQDNEDVVLHCCKVFG